MSNIFNVSTSTDLYTALSQAKGGETILLAGGNYGDFNLLAKSGFNYRFSDNVTIRSADPDDPAVFNSLDVRDGGNMTFDGILFDYVFQSGTPIHVTPFKFSNCDNITIRNSVFDGDLAQGVSANDDGLGYGIGLVMGGSRGSTVENNEFFDFFRGIAMGSGSDARILGNNIHDLRMDGMNFSQMQGIVIEDNYIHDFKRSKLASDHADMIQFWTNNTDKPSTDIMIRGNTLDVGGGDSTQSIFMRNDLVDRGLAGEEMFYRNVIIENNTIVNGHANGLVIGETMGLTIRNNSVLHADGMTVDGTDANSEIPKIRVSQDSQNVTITHNAAAAIWGFNGQSDWIMNNNAYVQDQSPLDPGYYGDVFITSSMYLTDAGHRFIAIPGGMLDTLKAGSSALHWESANLDPRALFDVIAVEGDASMRLFEAFESGIISTLPAGVTLSYEWTFSDGTSATGPTVQKRYASPGYDDVTLTLHLSNGDNVSSSARVGINGGEILSMTADGIIYAHDNGAVQQLSDAQTASGLRLGGDDRLVVDREHITAIFGSDNFDIDLSLQANQIDSNGELFRLQGTFIAGVEKGELVLRVFPDDLPQTTLVTDGANLTDGARHDVNISFADGIMQVSVDGKVLTSATVPSTFGDNVSSNLTFGRDGYSNFDGYLSNFSIAVDADAFWGEAYTISMTPTVPTALPAPIISETPEIIESVAEVIKTVALDLAAGVGYSLSNERMTLTGSASILEKNGDIDLVMHGKNDSANLGRIKGMENSDQVGFSIDFQRDGNIDGATRLVWNHLKVGLEVVDDGLRVRVATEDEGFKNFDVRNLGLSDHDLHNATMLLDTDSDRLQVTVDNEVVLDVNDTDFDIVGAGGREWGWKLGGAWTGHLDGTITDFQMSDHFTFATHELIT